MSEIRICKYCGMELLEDVPHGLRNCRPTEPLPTLPSLRRKMTNLPLDGVKSGKMISGYR